MTILEVKDLRKYFSVEDGIFASLKAPRKAVDGVSFFLEQGRNLGIVGESGCGKSTLAKLILKLLKPDSGEIVFSFGIEQFRKDVGIVFQDPLLSLDPRMRIKDILLEPLLTHRLDSDISKIKGLLDSVGLEPDILSRLPSQLSGGQRQRVCIARSLASQPKLLILDEPISSLDLITQRQILELLLKLKDEFKMTYIFISHNMAVVKKIAGWVMVMLEGKIIEQGLKDDIFSHPKSDYTKKLLEAAR